MSVIENAVSDPSLQRGEVKCGGHTAQENNRHNGRMIDAQE
jgi:hypothetical protein